MNRPAFLHAEDRREFLDTSVDGAEQATELRRIVGGDLQRGAQSLDGVDEILLGGLQRVGGVVGKPVAASNVVFRLSCWSTTVLAIVGMLSNTVTRSGAASA